MNILACISEFFTAILELLTVGWDFAVGATWDNARIRRFIAGAFISLGICLLMIALGFLFKLKVLIVVASALAALIAFAIGKALRIAVKISIELTKLGESATKTAIGKIVSIPILGKMIDPLGDISEWTAIELSKALQSALTGIKNSLSFAVTIAMTFAFIGAFTAIRGVGYYTLNNLMVLGLSALFTSMFFVYASWKLKTFGYVLYVAWMYLFIGWFVIPIQVQGTMDMVEGWTIKNSLIATYTHGSDILIAVPAKTPLYSEEFGKFVYAGKSGEKEINARVINRKNDPDSKEPMYEAKFPLDGFDNLYVGGKNYYVPASMVTPVPVKVAKIKTSGGNKTEGSGGTKYFGLGYHEISLEAGESVLIRLPDPDKQPVHWELAPEKKGDYEMTPYGGQAINYSKEVNKYTRMDRINLFYLSTKEKMIFKLNVTPQQV